MTKRNCNFARGMFVLLICVLCLPAMVQAKPLTAEAVHTRIVKRGLGNWVGVQLQDGVALMGRIVSIDDQTFSLQLHNDPEVTAIFYSQVVQIETGISRGGFWAITAAGIGGAVILAVVAHHEMQTFKSQMPTLPVSPAMPVFP